MRFLIRTLRSGKLTVKCGHDVHVDSHSRTNNVFEFECEGGFTVTHGLNHAQVSEHSDFPIKVGNYFVVDKVADVKEKDVPDYIMVPSYDIRSSVETDAESDEICDEENE